MPTTSAARSALALLLAASPLPAQLTSPIGPEASIVRPGMIRAGVTANWANGFSQTGQSLTAASLGSPAFPRLLGVESATRRLSGSPAFSIDLGTSSFRADQTTATTTAQLELGIANRFSVYLGVPLVRTRSDVGFNLASGTGSFGANPALSVAAAFNSDTVTINRLARARTQLSSLLASCLGSTAPQCSDVNARRTTATTLVGSASDAGADLTTVFLGSPVVPRSGSGVASAINGRLSSLATEFASFGVGFVPGQLATAAAPLTAAELSAFLEAGALGDPLNPLRSADNTTIGDVDVEIRYQLLDGIGPVATGSRRRAIRAVASAAVRLPTGGRGSASDLAFLENDAGQTDITGGIAADFLLTPRFWVSAGAAYTNQLSHSTTLRVIPTGGAVTLPTLSTELVDRDPGNIIAFGITPRFSFGGFLTAVASYGFRSRGEDRITATGSTPPLAGTARTDHAIGAGFSYANFGTAGKAQPRFPVEASFLHSRLSASGGDAGPRRSSDEIRVRIYTRLFGNR